MSGRLSISVVCRLLMIGAVLLLGAVRPSAADDAPAAAPFARWEAAIAEFEARDREQPSPEGAVLFVGSSSIRRWDTAAEFPKLTTINRGFGGSQLADAVHFAPRIVIPYKPHTIVLYAGDNDLAAEKSPEQVAADFEAFVDLVRAELPETRILYLAVKPSPRRRELLAEGARTNRLIAAAIERRGDPRIELVDVATPMLDSAGEPRGELFVEDNLHLNERGYRLWHEVLWPYLKDLANN